MTNQHTHHQSQQQVEVVQNPDPDIWDEFVEANGGSAFTKWEWGTTAENYGHERLYLAAADRSTGELYATLPLVRVTNRLLYDTLVSVPYASRGSLVWRPDTPEHAKLLVLDRANELADSLAVDYVNLRSRDLGEITGYEHNNQYVAFEIPLDRDPETNWAAMSSSRRGHVRKGEENLSVRVGDSIDDLREYYRLHLKSMRGHGTPPHSLEFFEHIWDEYYEQGHLRLYLAECDGLAVNGTLDFPFGDWVYHWGEVSDYEYRDLDGGSLLVWRGIEWAAENGYQTFDMGRTREGSGIYMYKKTFGGEKVPLDDYYYFPDGTVNLPDPDSEMFEPFKRLWSHVPLSLTRVIGPKIRGSIDL